MSEYTFSIEEALGEGIVLVTKDVERITQLNFAIPLLIKSACTFAIIKDDKKEASYFIARKLEDNDEFLDQHHLPSMSIIKKNIKGRIIKLWINGKEA